MCSYCVNPPFDLSRAELDPALIGQWLIPEKEGWRVDRVSPRPQTPSKEKQVRQAVQSFYDAFNAHGFGRAAEYATEDWNHINPFRGRTRGPGAVLSDLKFILHRAIKDRSWVTRDLWTFARRSKS